MPGLPAAAAPFDLLVVPVEQLVPNKEQARQSERDEETWVELVESIRRHGVKQPLLVRPLDGDGKYRVVDGHGRLAAAKEAGLKAVPCMIERALDRESEELRLQYHTNQLREGLRPLDQARLFKRLMKSDGMNQQQVAEFLGVSQSYVSDCVQVLQAPRELRARVDEGTLSAKKAVALMRAQKKQRAKAESAADNVTPSPLPARGKGRAAAPALNSYTDLDHCDVTSGLRFSVLGKHKKSPPVENVIVALRRWLSLLELRVKHDS
jgi:ParB/RepB/Spo0J family partition protein